MNQRAVGVKVVGKLGAETMRIEFRAGFKGRSCWSRAWTVRHFNDMQSSSEDTLHLASCCSQY